MLRVMTPNEALQEDAQNGGWCPECDYDLTGNVSGRCPECGWDIDWDRVARHEEYERVGTPVFRARGLRVIPATLKTLAIMLFRPVLFSRVIRADEPIWPALLVAGAALVGMSVYMYARFRSYWFSPGLGALIVLCLQVTGFTVLGRWRRPMRAPQRCRLAALVSLYSTLFVAAWPLVDVPVVVFERPNYLWPPDLVRLGGDDLLRSLMFYWWWAIVSVFAVVRARPRWCGLILVAAVPGIVIVAQDLAASAACV